MVCLTVTGEQTILITHRKMSSLMEEISLFQFFEILTFEAAFPDLWMSLHPGK